MTNDEDDKSDKPLHRQRMHFTPNGTEFRTELTEEGRRRVQSAEKAKMNRTEATMPIINREKLRKTFERAVKMNRSNNRDLDRE